MSAQLYVYSNPPEASYGVAPPRRTPKKSRTVFSGAPGMRLYEYRYNAGGTQGFLRLLDLAAGVLPSSGGALTPYSFRPPPIVV